MIVIYLWNLRIIDFLTELKFVNLMVFTLSRLTKPFFGKLLFLYLLFMVYCEAGSYMYGGKITKKTAMEADPNLAAYYWLMNFNDFPSGMVTLFQIMIVNNWFVTTNMYIAIFGNSWPVLFFTTFWVFSVLLLLNIVTASVIEIFSASKETVNASFRRLSTASWL